MATNSCVVRKLRSLVLITICVYLTQCSTDEKRNRVNLILIGATGDLAKRYLWQGLFNLYRSVRKTEEKTSIRFYGGARGLSNQEGSVALPKILETAIKCDEDRCNRDKAEFLELCTYVKLSVESEYEDLQRILGSSLEEEEEVELGRIFYLSIPPFSYERVSQYIDSKCRPTSQGAWVRVVLEKPFGSDFEAAQKLCVGISRYLNEDETYRIDHYLGKGGIRQIAEFRKKNRVAYEPIWNKDFVEQVKIVLKETGGTEGRMGFYDHYGVIRDVFQNHLTEILVLIAAELSDDDSVAISYSKKSEVLKSLRIVTCENAVFGQYKQYNSQLLKEIPSYGGYSYTPTFAAVSMFIDSVRWRGVPFILVSGKSLDTRVGYVQIQFKRNSFCVGHNINCLPPKDIIFYIQGKDFDQPSVLLSTSLPAIKLPNMWEKIFLSLNNSSIWQGDKIVLKPPLGYDAYSTLIHDVFLGNKSMFISSEHLLLSWKIWTPLLEMSTSISMKFYTPDKVQELDFEIVQGKLRFISDTNNSSHGLESSYFTKLYQERKHTTSNSFCGVRLVSGSHQNIAIKLASEIKLAAIAKVRSGGIFHLALSGGSSPKLLLQNLAFSVDNFPWKQTHLWLVDERCVSLTDKQSNFRNIYENLLKYVGIPFFNVHPMEVNVAGRICDQTDKADEKYEELIKYYIADSSFDFVVLGVGNDGHTASLFPGLSSLESSKFVEFTRCSTGLTRMSLTLKVLNQSQQCAILIHGVHKQSIVKELSKCSVDINRLPVTGVKAVNRSVTWYIDNYALDY